MFVGLHRTRLNCLANTCPPMPGQSQLLYLICAGLMWWLMSFWRALSVWMVKHRTFIWSDWLSTVFLILQVVVLSCCTVVFVLPKAWGKKLFHRLVVQQRILVDLFADGSRVNKLWLYWVFSSVLFRLCADISVTGITGALDQQSKTQGVFCYLNNR